MGALSSLPVLRSLTFAAVLFSASAAGAGVRVVSVPGGGAVPDAEVDDRGGVHLVYVVGGNVEYVSSGDGGKTFGPPVRVNSQAATVHPAHMFRGPDLAVGKDRTLHVVWYNDPYQRKAPKDQWGIEYARRTAGAKTFTAARNLNHRPSDNFSLAADGRGNVAAIWMAAGLFVSTSTDGGASFAEPARISGTDPCECCASRAFLDASGALFTLYRDKAGNDRDIYLVRSRPDGSGPVRHKLSATPWHINACPMTGAFLGSGSPSALVGAWEREGQIYFGRMDRDGKLLPPGEIATPRADYLRKFPVALALGDGSTMVAWKRGKTLEWQSYDGSGKPRGPISAQDTASPHRPAGVVTAIGEALLFP